MTAKQRHPRTIGGVIHFIIITNSIIQQEQAPAIRTLLLNTRALAAASYP